MAVAVEVVVLMEELMRGATAVAEVMAVAEATAVVGVGATAIAGVGATVVVGVGATAVVAAVAVAGATAVAAAAAAVAAVAGATEIVMSVLMRGGNGSRVALMRRDWLNTQMSMTSVGLSCECSCGACT